MFEQLSQYGDLGLFILRLGVAAVFLYHSWPKLRNPQIMAQGMGWPKEAVILLGLVEFLSSLALIVGLWMQLAALLLGIVMVGAIYHKTAKWKIPFISQNSTGWEFDLILLTANIAIILTDGGSIKIF